jgi:tetraacyldisaccharide 4'-kinase
MTQASGGPPNLAAKLAPWLQAQWERNTPWQLVLRPLAVLFGVLTRMRRALYRFGLLPSVKLPVPIVVVGNISVGGTGKTPLVIWLVELLRGAGFHPGVISRGYGRVSQQLLAVRSNSSAADVGDEPLLIARRTSVPVFVANDRVAAAQALVRARPDCDVIICDDGLQHYRLRRDVEIVVVDGERKFGNGYLMPAGPLREGKERLEGVDAIIVNGGREGRRLSAVLGLDYEGMMFQMTLNGEVFHNLKQPQQRVGAAQLHARQLHAIAGIAHPERFFRHLRRLGVSAAEHAFADHHAFRAEELDFSPPGAVLMTEKDAVKCEQFARDDWWVLAVGAQITDTFGHLILDKLHGRQAA